MTVEWIDVTVSNKLGLHARAAAKLTQLADQYQSEIHITRAGQRVNAKSIMGVMMLAAGRGSVVRIDATRSEEHTSELQSRGHLVCRLLLEKKKKKTSRR